MASFIDTPKYSIDNQFLRLDRKRSHITVAVENKLSSAGIPTPDLHTVEQDSTEYKSIYSRLLSQAMKEANRIGGALGLEPNQGEIAREVSHWLWIFWMEQHNMFIPIESLDI